MPAKRAQSAGHSLVSTRSAAGFLAILLAVDLGFRMHTLNCHRWTPSPIFHQCTPSLQAILLGSAAKKALTGGNRRIRDRCTAGEAAIESGTVAEMVGAASARGMAGRVGASASAAAKVVA
ncbi:unnamed protein product [Lampetra planeri]